MSYYNRYKRKYYSGMKGRTIGQFKAAKKGQDVMNFVVNSNIVFSANYNNDDNTGVAVINMWDVLRRNSNFNSMKNMYDQVRIDGIKVNLNVTDAATTLNDITGIRNITIYTAWDKTGLSQDQAMFYGSDEGKTLIEPDEYDNTQVISYKNTIGSGIVNASQQTKSNLNSYQRWKQYLSCYPTLAQEKQQYLSTADIREFIKDPNSVSNYKYLSEDLNLNVNEIMNCSNPCSPFENTNIRFKPTLYVGVFKNTITGNNENARVLQYGNCDSVIFNAEISMSLTFKNMKAASVQR